MRSLHPTRTLARGMLAALALTLLPWAGARAADFNVLISLDPSDGARSVIATAAPAASLSKLLGVPARMLVSGDFKDSMRATRTTENQVIIGPAHVTASALAHGYALAAVSGTSARFALVARHGVAKPADLRGLRLYLPQQDSLRSYIARGLLEQADLSLKSFAKVEYRNTSGAGLIAIGLGMTDATVAELGEAETWIKANPGKASIVQTSQEIPGGLAIAILKSMPAADRERLARWATDPNSPMLSIASFRAAAPGSEQGYGYVASLGIVTPDRLAGAQLVGADQVRDLIAKGGVVVVDTRSRREFTTEHIAEAVLAPYGENSLKERDYDVSKDDLGAIAKLDRSKPTVFLCNGPECWKSYKASREAVKMGFKTVYWFRGGMPEWRSRGLPTVRAEALAAAERR
ncbi:MAG TPA: rhodanese-like domain-containing protein [Burkholderiaceae bacterium]|nr:rhodanese-like domain-containing protein [Burkholderiaceae bacterium]HSC01167.1 rhodanese-like domain-containing protein [Burkholderiaceae bacterium]